MITPTLIDPETRPAPGVLHGPKGVWIGGQEVFPSTAETFETIDPTTQEVLTNVATADAADVEQAVAAARAAYEDPSWAAIAPEDRTRLLLQVADVIEANADELATQVLDAYTQVKSVVIQLSTEIRTRRRLSIGKRRRDPAQRPCHTR